MQFSLGITSDAAVMRPAADIDRQGYGCPLNDIAGATLDALAELRELRHVVTRSDERRTGRAAARPSVPRIPELGSPGRYAGGP